MAASVITRREMVDFFKDNQLNLKDIIAQAEKDGRPKGLIDALKKADKNGDGVINGVKEAEALFDALDKFDHDGSRNTVRLDKNGVDSLLQKAEQSSQHTPSSAKPSKGLRRPGDGEGSTTDAPQTGTTESGDTLHPSTNPGSTLSADRQRLGRRYMGAGSVDVVQKDGKTAAFQWTGKMDVDTDGGTSAQSRADRFHQSQTSMKFAGNKSLDADKLPYVVLPPSLAKATGAKLGDLVEVKSGGKSMYAIYGDVGPSMKLGEGSISLAKAFDKRASGNNGIDNGITYTVLPGSGAKAGITNGGHAVTAQQIQDAGAAAFTQARADGVLR
jgi:hypothetical protein